MERERLGEATLGRLVARSARFLVAGGDEIPHRLGALVLAAAKVMSEQREQPRACKREPGRAASSALALVALADLHVDALALILEHQSVDDVADRGRVEAVAHVVRALPTTSIVCQRSSESSAPLSAPALPEKSA